MTSVNAFNAVKFTQKYKFGEDRDQIGNFEESGILTTLENIYSEYKRVKNYVT